MVDGHTPHPRLAERAREGAHLTQHEHTGLNGRLAVFITRRFGSMAAFWTLLIWILGWVALATASVGIFSRDPYPFTFLLFLSNLVQLCALPILAVGQQVLSKASDKQAEQTYKDAEAILRMQDEILQLTKANHELIEEMPSFAPLKKKKK